MKRFLNYYLSLTLIASLFFMASCGEDDDPIVDGPAAPLVTGPATGNESTVDVGEEVSFTVNVTAAGGFNNFIVYQTIGEGTRVKIDEESKESGTNPTTFSYPFTFTPEAEHAGETIEFEFLAVDEVGAGREGSYVHTVIVNEPQVVSYNAVLLAAPNAPTAPETNSTSETFFSTTTGETYSVKEVNSTTDPVSSWIDFGYFYGAQTNATIASPAQYPFPELKGFDAWGTKNDTKVKRTNLEISQSEFLEYNNAAQFQTIFESTDYEENQNQGRVNRLSAGHVLVFMTDSEKAGGSKYGLIYVNEIAGTDGQNGSINISVRVQP